MLRQTDHSLQFFPMNVLNKLKIFRYNLNSEVFSSIENGICIPWLRIQDRILNESCNDQKMMFFQL